MGRKNFWLVPGAFSGEVPYANVKSELGRYEKEDKKT